MRQIQIWGYGSQGTAWATCLRQAGWRVDVVLSRQGPSLERAERDGFRPIAISDIAPKLKLQSKSEPPLVALLVSDAAIGPAYRSFLSALPFPLTVVLAHGFSVYAGDLREMSSGHELALLAPKAIGPRLRRDFLEALGAQTHHPLVAAASSPPTRRPQLLLLAQALRFAPENLVWVDFETEAKGDLMSEQGLLCGGVFTLISYTARRMLEAGIPPRLVREECLTELELIASLIRERGVAGTFRNVSEAAQAGTICMKAALEKHGLKSAIEGQFAQISDKSFVNEFKSGEWKSTAAEFLRELERLDEAL